MRKGYVYMLMNQAGTVIYTGVTTNLPARISAHREGMGSVFTARYRTTRLVYAEELDSQYEAIVREKQIKSWSRDRKLRLIRSLNPTFGDLM